MCREQIKWANSVIQKLKNRPHYITFKEIEAETGVSRQYLRRLSSGEVTEPSVYKLDAISKYFEERDH